MAVIGNDFSQVSHSVELLKFRMSEGVDARKIREFFVANPDETLKDRDEDEIRERAELGKILLVEDQHDNLVASFSAFERGNVVGSSQPRWVEIGAALCAISGMGLYNKIMPTIAVNEFLFNPPSDCIVATAVTSSGHVVSMLKDKMGWELYDPSEDLAALFDIEISEENTKKTYVIQGDQVEPFRVTSPLVPNQARLTDAFLSSASIPNKHTGNTVRLDFSALPLMDKLPEIRELAYGRTGQRLESVPAFSLEKARQELSLAMSQSTYGINI